MDPVILNLWSCLFWSKRHQNIAFLLHRLISSYLCYSVYFQQYCFLFSWFLFSRFFFFFFHLCNYDFRFAIKPLFISVLQNFLYCFYSILTLLAVWPRGRHGWAFCNLKCVYLCRVQFKAGMECVRWCNYSACTGWKGNHFEFLINIIPAPPPAPHTHTHKCTSAHTHECTHACT